MRRSRPVGRLALFLLVVGTSSVGLVFLKGIFQPGAVLVTPQEEPPPLPRIAYAAIPNGGSDTDIFSATIDGSYQEQLTNYSGPDNQPVWSPLQERIAFVSDRDEAGNMDIYTMDADGTNVTRVTTDPAIDGGPDWSPDGTRLAFERTGEDGHTEIYTVELGIGPEERLTNNDVIDAQPAWLPGGNQISFTTNDAGNADIYLLDLPTREKVRLTYFPGSDTSPAWSSSSVEGLDLTVPVMAFVRADLGSGAGDLYYLAMDAGGWNPVRLTASPDDEQSPAWSPDGNSLLYLSLGLGGEEANMLDVRTGGVELVLAGVGATVDW